MRYLSLGIGIILSISSFSALADDSNQNGLGAAFGVGTGGGFSIKKSLGDTHQILAGFNVSKNQYHNQYTFNGITTTSNDNSHGYSIHAGIRHFLEKEKLSKFIQLSIDGGYGTSSGNGFTSSSKSISLLPGYGIEYFIAPDLSIEGIVGFGLVYSSGSASNTNHNGKTFQLPVAGTALTYYW